jgi:hypothetical protein
MLRKFSIFGGVVAALFFVPQADAGSALNRGATNPGLRYAPYGTRFDKFHTNPGGKYVYRGYGDTFRTNPGGKYVYPGYQKWAPGLDH